MNEQIQQLKQQAVLHANKEFAATGSHELWTDQFAEKFAELIVRECGAALSPMLRDMISRGQAYNLIKEHFGVE